MSNQIPNQANFQDEQNFDIDINKVYNDFIVAIDKIRSYTNTSTIDDNFAKSSFMSGDISKLKSLTKIENSVQESRCHAFYRIIGFPVVSKNFKIYNPGLDIVYNTRTINLSAKLKLAANPIDKFRSLSIVRERYVSDTLNIFSQPDTIDASTLALSGIKIRKFIVPLDKNSDPFDMEIKNQQYKIDFSSLIGNDKDIKLTEYIDILGNKPTKLNFQRTHIIKPFMVDPVIDFTINDSTKLVAIPFVPSKSNLFIKDGTNGFVNRPLIEQVIRDRFATGNQISTLGTSDQSVINYVKNVIQFTGQSIISQISSGDPYKISDQMQFVKFLNIIGTMMKKIVESQLIINDVQSKYYWLPIPAINGPEGGSSVQGVFLSSNVSSDFITDKDKAIIDSKIKVTINQINAQTAEVQGIPDMGSFSFDSFKTTFSSDTSDSLGDNSSQTLQNLSDARTSDMQKANDALRTIEIIMGEFSGFGLCDIIAILGALYIMPRDSLLGFLDDDAINRMNTSLDLSDPVSSPGVNVAMNDLSLTIKDFYNLMDKIYQDLSQNNGLQ